MSEPQVEQRHRDFAANWYKHLGPMPAMREGLMDDHSSVLAVARFEQSIRNTLIAEGMERAAGIAVEQQVLAWRQANSGDLRKLDLHDVALRYRDLVAGIRAEAKQLTTLTD